MFNKKSKSVADSSSSGSALNPCPICLGSVKQEAYLDRCFHKFCHHCISQWAKVVSGQDKCSRGIVECPVCKRENLSIVYGWDGDSFEQHYLSREKSFSLTSEHKYRLRCYSIKPDAVSRKFNIQKYWESCRYLNPNKWFQIWLRREIQALTKEEDVEVIVHHILGVFELFVRRKRQEQFKHTPEQKRRDFQAFIGDAARPFLLSKTEGFVSQVELFLASGLNIDAYDQVYLGILGSEAPDAQENETSREINDQSLQMSSQDLFYDNEETVD